MGKKNLLLLIILSVLFVIIIGIGLDVVKAKPLVLTSEGNPVTANTGLELCSSDLLLTDLLVLDRLNAQLPALDVLNAGSKHLLNAGSKHLLNAGSKHLLNAGSKHLLNAGSKHLLNAGSRLLHV